MYIYYWMEKRNIKHYQFQQNGELSILNGKPIEIHLTAQEK